MSDYDLAMPGGGRLVSTGAGVIIMLIITSATSGNLTLGLFVGLLAAAALLIALTGVFSYPTRYLDDSTRLVCFVAAAGAAAVGWLLGGIVGLLLLLVATYITSVAYLRLDT